MQVLEGTDGQDWGWLRNPSVFDARRKKSEIATCSAARCSNGGALQKAIVSPVRILWRPHVSSKASWKLPRTMVWGCWVFVNFSVYNANEMDGSSIMHVFLCITAGNGSERTASSPYPCSPFHGPNTGWDLIPERPAGALLPISAFPLVGTRTDWSPSSVSRASDERRDFESNVDSLGRVSLGWFPCQLQKEQTAALWLGPKSAHFFYALSCRKA